MGIIDTEFRNNLALFELPKDDPRLVESARLVICGRARSASEASLFLDMLGIRGTEA